MTGEADNGPRVTDEPPFTPPERWRDEALNAEFLAAEGRIPRLQPHHHPTWQVGQVTRGSMVFSVGDRAAVATAPALVVTPPLVTHAIAAHEDDATCAYVQVELSADMQLGTWSRVRPVVLHEETAYVAMSRLVEASRAARAEGERLGRLVGLAERLVEIAAAAADGDDGAPRDWVAARVRGYLAAHLDRKVAIEELVTEVGVSRATLMRRFRRAMGTTPRDYHLSLRLRRACESIDNGASLAQASIEAGFYDQSHLARQARSVLAMRPGTWRDRRRVPASSTGH
ncbi:MAG: AraC family transcriptional regulator [Myxococcota bacterium]